ncbi:MAG TPA: hypothetical protein VL240_01930 [Candidatus Binatia bacterium]|nr:hypothetical protein [Candidatus Binatia bacterium]
MSVGEKLAAPRNLHIAVNAQRSGQRAAAPRAERWASAATLTLSVLAVALRFFFWYYTRRTWEDALITVQHAENAALGLGLTHVPGGPRIHGFTSPLSVLIPLLGEWVHHGFGLPLLKFVSAICGGITVWLAMRICQRLGAAFPITLLVGGYLAIEHQQLLFGMAGMETQIAVTVLLLSIYSLFDFRPILIGVSLALCMLARPDFCFWTLLVAGLVGWRCRKKHDWGALETVAVALLLIYGPWIVFTTWYYGNPIPNTILAKAWGFGSWYASLSPSAFVLKLWERTRFIFAILSPAYGGNGTGYAFFSFDPRGTISVVVLMFAAAGTVVAWRTRSIPGLAIAGFVVVYSAYYLFLVSVVALWYCIPLAAIAIMAAGLGVNAMLHACFRGRWRAIAGYAVALAYLASLAAIMPQTFRGERDVQRFVEEGVRKEVGLYLASVMGPKQTVGCEPLGYIGYYSRHVVYAYPGMCNREVVRFVHQHPKQRNLIDMLAYFRPDYIALRPMEYRRGLRTGNYWLTTEYQKAAIFRTPEQERLQLLFPNDNLDTEFYVLKRTSAGGEP